MTGPPRQRDRFSWARTAIRRTISTLRHANEELLRAHEVMARPVGTASAGPLASTTGTSATALHGGDGAALGRQASAAGGGKPAA